MMRRGALSATATVGDVLRWVAGRRESGGLFVEGTENAVSGAAYLVDGDIAFVTTGHGLPMEQQFLAAGVLTREQLPAVMAQVHAGRDLAFVLDAEPGVEFRGVVQVIHDRSVEALGKLLGVTSGTYLLDRYQQHPFGMLGHWSAGPMIDLAERKYRVGQLDPGTAGLLGLVPQPTAGTDGDRDVVLSPVELRLLLASREGRRLDDVAGRAGLGLPAAALLAKGLVARGLLEFATDLTSQPVDEVAGTEAEQTIAETSREAGLIASA